MPSVDLDLDEDEDGPIRLVIKIPTTLRKRSQRIKLAETVYRRLVLIFASKEEGAQPIRMWYGKVREGNEVHDPREGT